MNYIHRLPIELVREHILPYTYCPQSSELCEDIRDYYSVRHAIVTLYTERYSNSDEDEFEWISNDLTRFMNQDLPTMYFGYRHFYVDKIRRLFLFRRKTMGEATRFIARLYEKPVAFETNLRLALLRPSERSALVDFMRLNS